jgi:hypothetical protein
MRHLKIVRRKFRNGFQEASVSVSHKKKDWSVGSRNFSILQLCMYCHRQLWRIKKILKKMYVCI